ncbi:GGDEF domain-containing protein [Lactiplantibacillus nangangensis]|uniref:GGDEF domain-containing protein n=1 Tax=Lactiplantibacillus nangangensis TaxID=2559917 RepID=A0ABW1SIB4_9LACO|nr:GGDEF domain-containing protein [Lactiplantibacillus nangangensis]
MDVRYFKWLHLFEGALVVGSIALLRAEFIARDPGNVVSWGYIIAQLTILLLNLYTMHNLAITVINLVTPWAFYGEAMVATKDWSYVALFIGMWVVLAATIIYINHHRENVLMSEWRYILLQATYGLAWCFMIWSAYHYNLLYIINVLVLFVVYMLVIRFFVTRIDRVIEHFVLLNQEVNYDELTGVLNRAKFDATTLGVVGIHRQNPEVPITMAMFDIDHFKLFNDRYGHLAGDHVLKYVAQHFYQALNQPNKQRQLFRYGGEEFVVIFRGESAAEVQPVLTLVRNSLQQNPLHYSGKSLTVTVSIGISALAPTDVDFDTWFKRVDHYLYLSKEAGRDRITVEGTTQPFDKI